MLTRFLKRILYVLLTGYILSYFSEWMFWLGRPINPNITSEFVPTWLFYSWITFIFLSAVYYFRVRTVWAVFLAGALYGWLLEGGIVQTMYDLFPFHISWTGLAWHGLVSVVYGWYFLPRWLRKNKFAAIGGILLFAVFIGFWAIGWWSEPDVELAPIEVVFTYNTLFTLLLILTYILRDRIGHAIFTPSRIEILGAVIPFILYFIFITIPMQPLALVVLPPLLFLLLATLWRNHRSSAKDALIEYPVQNAKVYWLLLLIPTVAVSIYAIALMAGFMLGTLQIVFYITMPLGFILFVLSIYKVWRQPVPSQQ